jgi:hypothetical protein
VSEDKSDPGKAAASVVRKIERNGGEFVRIDGKIFVLVDGKRIEISPDFNNHAYAAVQIDHCGVGTAEYKGRAICQRVAVLASRKASNVRVAKFSALSKDKSRLYLPVEGGRSLQITSREISLLDNGANPDSLWLEHPKDNPFRFVSNCNVPQSLDRFEQLCVNSQSCTDAHAWFVAMHEGLFPYVRDFATSRMLVEHLGPSQRGKTTGAQRFTNLHGLGDVLGDVTAAYFRNNCDSLGLAVLDNKEHDDQTRDLITLLLFAATGAQNGRSTQDGGAREMKDRPVVVLTSIEGVFKRELQKRVIYIPYGVRLSKANGDRDYIEEQIAEHRDELLSGLCHVLRRFMTRDTDPINRRFCDPSEGPFLEFSGYMRQMSKLLHSYAIEAGRPDTWADNIIRNWFETLGNVPDKEGDELENHVLTLIALYEAVRDKSQQADVSPQQITLLGCFKREEHHEFAGQIGTLYVTAAGKLLNALNLNRIGSNALPKTSQAFGRRLEQAEWSTLRVLKASDDPRLKRQSNERPIGIFRPAHCAQDYLATEHAESVVGDAFQMLSQRDECVVSLGD